MKAVGYHDNLVPRLTDPLYLIIFFSACVCLTMLTFIYQHYVFCPAKAGTTFYWDTKSCAGAEWSGFSLVLLLV